MAISKSLRFEVFSRDGFSCRYCGRRPPEVVLELDHLHPRAKGGTDEEVNLITSCFDCNRGKSAKVISDVAPRPDADLALLKLEQERCEVVRYLKAKKKRDAANGKLCNSLRETWADSLTRMVPSDRVLIPWIERYGPQEIEKAIRAAIPFFVRNRTYESEGAAFNKLLPWVGAILRNRDQDRESGAIQ